MKTDAEIDLIMAAMPEFCRRKWCGGEYGACACMGCVQIANRAIIFEKIRGERYRGDPEYINEAWLMEHGALYGRYKLSHEEWKSWLNRQ